MGSFLFDAGTCFIICCSRKQNKGERGEVKNGGRGFEQEERERERETGREREGDGKREKERRKRMQNRKERGTEKAKGV